MSTHIPLFPLSVAIVSFSPSEVHVILARLSPRRLGTWQRLAESSSFLGIARERERERERERAFMLLRL